MFLLLFENVKNKIAIMAPLNLSLICVKIEKRNAIHLNTFEYETNFSQIFLNSTGINIGVRNKRPCTFATVRHLDFMYYQKRPQRHVGAKVVGTFVADTEYSIQIILTLIFKI